MNLQCWDFTLLDTGFFRSGQPFHAGEGGHSRITSHFPPSISTLQGAIRSTLATARGWLPGQNESWPDELGDNKDLGLLSLLGPYLVWDKKPLFPAPLNLLIKKMPGANSKSDPGLIKSTFLTPGETCTCDLGPDVSLPRKKESLDGAHPSENLYLTRSGYSAVAKGKPPATDETYFQESLWSVEPRIGLKRNAGTRTAEDHNLYRIGHIRPEYYLKIRVIVLGLPPDWPEIKHRVVPLGGEGRLAGIKINSIDIDDYQNLLPPCPLLEQTKDGQIRYTVSLITRSVASEDQLKLLIRKGPIDAPGNCISACIGKPQLHGGWDLIKNEPRPLQPCLPPGSTWFFEAAATDKENIEALHGCHVGNEEFHSLGYGQVLIGKWEVD